MLSRSAHATLLIGGRTAYEACTHTLAVEHRRHAADLATSTEAADREMVIHLCGKIYSPLLGAQHAPLKWITIPRSAASVLVTRC